MQPDPKVHVIDDDPDVLRSLAFMLNMHGMAVKTYTCAPEFLEAAAVRLGGCVVSDVRMPEMDGIELLRALRAGGSDLPFIVMTGHADVAMAIEAMKEGAMDFIEKPFSDTALTTMVTLALTRWRETTERLRDFEASHARLAVLSPRELEVLDAIAKGNASKAIAHDLGLSVRTVEVHRANILSKLDVENAFLAVALLVAARRSPSMPMSEAVTRPLGRPNFGSVSQRL